MRRSDNIKRTSNTSNEQVNEQTERVTRRHVNEVYHQLKSGEFFVVAAC